MRSNLRKLKSCILILLIAVSIFSVNSIILTQAQPPSSLSVCKVEILGGSPIMYPGQYVSLTANITGTETKNYTWTVEGNIVKDYDDNVYNSTYLTSYLNIDSYIYVSCRLSSAEYNILLG